MDAPCINLYEPEKFLATQNQEYINARKELKIDIYKFYSWLYGSSWDCDASINASAKISQTFLDSAFVFNYYTIKIQSVEKVGIVQHDRDSKKVIVDSLGKTKLIDEPNPLLQKYPKNLLYKIRSNPCFPTNGSTVYFDCKVRIENLVWAVTFKYRPVPKLASDYSDVSQTRKDYGAYWLYILDGTRYMQAKFSIYIKTRDAAYDYKARKYIPDVTFFDSPVGWAGTPNYKNSSGKGTLFVDGFSIKSGTLFDFGQYSGEEGDPYQYDINVKWKTVKRDL